MGRRATAAWFCLVAALTAASCADPLLEAASNAGLFGRGTFTDNSNADVGPALAIALCFAIVYLASRLREGAPGSVPTRAWRLFPAIFLAQIATVYVMESCEQLAIYGHLLGPAIWLGAPVAIALGVHALFGVLALAGLAALLDAIYGSTIRLIRHLRILATRPRGTGRPARLPIASTPPRTHAWYALTRLGERAPPSYEAA